MCSDVPFNGPISEVRVARVDGQWVINPTFEQIENADIELMVGATYDNIMMVRERWNEVSEAELPEALKSRARGNQEALHGAARTDERSGQGDQARVLPRNQR